MSSILFVTWDGGGNVPPAIALARELDGRGHQVRFLGHASQVAALTAAGFDVVRPTRARDFSSLEANSPVAMMACFGLATSNFSAMAMEKMGEIAGTASSLQGFITTLAGALIGAAIGQAFNGTTIPLYGGFVVLGLLAFAAVAFAERGRLFRAS